MSPPTLRPARPLHPLTRALLVAAALHAAAARAEPPESLTKEIPLGPDARNPIEIERLHGTAWDFVTDTFRVEQKCYAYTTREPAVVLKLSHGIGELEITAPGATVLLAQVDNGRIAPDRGHRDTPNPKV